MKLQNAKSPEMARFLSMMLNERKCAWERRVIAGQKSEERAKHVNDRITWLEGYMDRDDVSYIDRLDTHKDVLSYKNELRFLESNIEDGRKAAVRVAQINKALQEIEKAQHTR